MDFESTQNADTCGINAFMTVFTVLWFLWFLSSSCEGQYEADVGLGTQALEFLSEELAPVECQTLVRAFSLDKRTDENEGQSCLEELIKYNEELSLEGPDVVQSVFRHRLSQLGRPDLADWLSRVNAHKAGICSTANPPSESNYFTTPVEYKWTYLDFAICTLATWAFLSLGWLVIQVIVIKMKAQAIFGPGRHRG